MEFLQFYITLGTTEYQITPIYDNLKIKKVRDEKQRFVVRTVADGTITFVDDDFVLVASRVGERLGGRIVETLNQYESYEYNVIYELQEEIDYNFSTLAATIAIRDNWYELYQNIDRKTKIGEYYIASIVENNGILGKIENNNISTSSTLAYCCSYIWGSIIGEQQEFFQFPFFTRLASPQDPSKILQDLDDFYDWRFSFEDKLGYRRILIAHALHKHLNDGEIESLPEISFSEIFNALLDWFGVGLYYKTLEYTDQDGTNTYSFFDFDFLNALNSKIVEYIDIDTTEYKYLNKFFFKKQTKYSELNFEMPYNSIQPTEYEKRKYYFPVSANFAVKNITSTPNPYIYDAIEGTKQFNFMYANRYTNAFNVAAFDKQIFADSSYPFQSISGDTELLTILASNSTARCWFFNNRQLPLQFNRSKIRIYIDVTEYTNIGGGALHLYYGNASIKELTGAGSFFVDYFTYSNASAFSLRWIPVTGTVSLLATLKFRFEILENFTPSDFNNTGFCLLETQNEMIAPYNILKYNSSETSAKQCINVDFFPNETLNTNKANDYERVIEGVQYDRCIGNIDDFAAIRIGTTTEIIEEVERTFSNNHYSRLKIKTSTKLNNTI